MKINFIKRFAVKILLTAIVVPSCVLMILWSYVMDLWLWTTKANFWDKQANKDARYFTYTDIKEWFTTL